MASPPRSAKGTMMANAKGVMTVLIPPTCGIINVPGDYASIQAAVSAACPGAVIQIASGTYNEQVAINKPITLVGVGSSKPIVNFTGTAALANGHPTAFDVTAPSVRIENIQFSVDMSKLSSAVLASATDVSSLSIINNTINPYRSGAYLGAFGNRNAISINYGGPTSYRINGANTSDLVIQGNTIPYNDNGTPAATADDAAFRAGIATDGGGGLFSGNTIQATGSDLLIRFAESGAITIANNTFNGFGLELAEFNAGANSLSVTGNTFNGTAFGTFTSSLRLKNNINAIPTTVASNTFTGHTLGISLENYRAVTVDNNTFTPLANATTYRHVVENTKEGSSSSGTFTPNVALTLTRNTFNGSGAAGGTGLAFYNQDNDSPIFGTFTLGTAGNENTFASGLGTFIYLDNSTGTTNPNATPTVPWAVNLDATNNKFDVGTGPKLASTLTASERATLETKLFHKPDDARLGLITYFAPVHNLTQNTFFNAIQPAIDAANSNDVIELAETTFNERATITKPLTLSGVSQTGTILDGTGLGSGNGLTLQDNVADIKIGNLTIQKQTGPGNASGNGIYGKTNGNLQITGVVSVSNATHGIILETSGTLTNVSVTSSTLSSNGSRGFVIFNNLKQDITLSNNVLASNGLVGIDLNEGTATGVTISGNTISGSGDEGIGLLGGLDTGGANRITGNNLSNNGRYGIEVKSSIGTGALSGAGSLVIESNNISRSTDLAGSRDIAGISVTRRGAAVSVNTRETPQGAVVRNNIVSGYVNSGTGDGFGIVVEGINYQVTGNTVSGNDVGIQEQQTSVGQRNRTTGAPSDGDSGYDVSDYFDRGNSLYSCGVVASNTLSGNTLDTRAVGQSAAGRGLVRNTNTGASYCTIQAAVDAASAGNTLVVSAGTYTESVTVTKSLTINGAQVGVDPRTGRSGGESVVTTPVNDITNGNLFTVRADNVTIDGFTLDGDNPSIGGGLSAYGIDLNAGRAISNGANGSFNVALNGLTVQNNIIKNVARYGLTLFLENQAANVAMSNVLATRNLFDNIRSYGVYAEFNGYVSVVNNKMTRTRSGVGVFTIGTKYTGNGVPQITGNDLETEATGLYYNNFAGFGPPAVETGTPFNVANNTFRSLGAMNVAVRGYSLANSGHTFTNNTITAGAVTGFEVWNTPGGLTIKGGSVDGTTGRAVRESNYNTTFGSSSATNLLTVNGLSITNSPLGILVQDSPQNTNGASTSAVITGNTQITGSGTFTAVAISGSDATATITGNASSFVGSGAGVGVDVSGGTASVTANRITTFATGISVSGGGQLASATNNFITGNGNGIVYAADVGATQGVVTVNNLSGSTGKAIVNNLASTTINANCNWFGPVSASTNPTYVTGNVTASQVLANGTDEDANAPGFQNTSCLLPAPILTASAPANPQGGSYNATYCIGENPTVTSSYTTGVNSFTVQPLSGGSTTVTTGNSVVISQGAGTYFVYATNTQNGYTSPVSATTTIQIQPNVTSFTSNKPAYYVGESVSLTALGCNVATASTPNLYFVRLRQLDGSNNENQGVVNLASGVTSYTYTQFSTASTTTYTITAECVNGGTGNVCSKTSLTLTVSPAPVVMVTPTSLTFVNSTQLPGSNPQVYTVSASNLTVSQLQITAPSPYLISVTPGSFGQSQTLPVTNGAVAPTSVTVALVSSTAGTFNGTITNVAGSASATVAVSGTTVSPSLSVMPTALSGFTTTEGTPSAIQTYTITALSQTGGYATAPAGVQIRTGTNAFGSSVIIPGSLSPITIPVDVRLSGANVGPVTGSITHQLYNSSNQSVANVAISGTVSATAPAAVLRVLHRDVDNYADNNAVQPNLQLVNDGAGSLPLSGITLRYYLTVEGTTPLSILSINYAQVGDRNVKLRYVALNPTRQGATGYVEYSFTPEAGNLASGANSGNIQSYFAKADYSSLNELDDYSYATVRDQLVANPHITAYYNGALVWGQEPGNAACPTISLTASNNGTLTCSQSSLILTASGGQTYAFSSGTTPVSANQVSVSSEGFYSVTATSANGCVDVATTRVYASKTLPNPDFATRGNSAIADGLTSVTVAQNSTPVRFSATNCSGTLTWTGNGQSGNTVLNVPTGNLGMFVYQATCTVGSCVSNPTSVTVTVAVPTNQPPVPVANANQTAAVGVPFSYTVNAFTDEMPASLVYSATITPTNGLSFNPAARVISGTPTSTGVVNVTITATDTGNLSATTTFSITVSPAPPTTPALTVLHRDVDNYPTNNAVQPMLQVVNNSANVLPLSAVTLRYYLTVESPSTLSNLFIFYAQVGDRNVKLRYVALNPTRQGATGYVEYSFTPEAGNLASGANSGNIQSYFAKADYSSLNELDDYSYATVRDQLVANPHITAYYNGALIWGQEPPSGGRQAATTEPATQLNVTMLSNPVQDDKVLVQVRGAGAEPLQLQLTTLQGRVIDQQQVASPQATDQYQLSVAGQSAGVFLLQVSTPTQRQTIKVIKVE